jgi:hypothetical protein
MGEFERLARKELLREKVPEPESEREQRSEEPMGEFERLARKELLREKVPESGD